MPNIIVKIYRQNGSAGNTERVLIRRVEIENSSAKKLTGNRAAKILACNFPEFLGMIKTEEGWSASRTIKPTEKCEYHFIWEYVVLSQED
jgi:hypothetical protein